MDRFRDFDTFWAEKAGEPITIKVFGEVHQLPPALPASIMVHTIRSHAEGKSDFDPSVIVRMAEGLFGRQRLDTWIDRGLTVDQLSDLIKWATEIYRGGGNEGNALPPGKTPGG